VKAGFKTGLFLIVPLIVLACLEESAAAQTLRTLHGFSSGSTNALGSVTNSDGSSIGDLLLAGNTLYGTAYSGGVWGNGTIFALNVDGTGFRVLHTFTASSGYGPVATYTNNDGARPNGGLILSGSTLYGVTSYGGLSGNGTVFSLNKDGTDFNVLYNFTGFSDGTNGPTATNADGAIPNGCVIISSNRLYGVTGWGGDSDRGTVYSLGIDSNDFSVIYSFSADTAVNYGGTNSDGAWPYGRLLLSGDVLYGTAMRGGDWGNGTLFAVNKHDTFTNLHSFQGTNEGAVPINGLLLSGSTLYGTSLYGEATASGRKGNGTVFRVMTDGSDYTTLYNFTPEPSVTNSHGAFPVAALILSGNTLYGAAGAGGVSGNGTLFALNIDGTGFTVLHSFAGFDSVLGGPNSDGANPFGRLTLSGNTLFGTTAYGGSSGNGTVFKISFEPQLSVTPSADKIVVSWPTNYAGFDYTGYTLQSAANLASPVWNTNLPAAVVINGQNVVTNPVSAGQQFFRLSQ
jgi:uncharacterized repeat protein (TIGR03803 family)